MMSQVAGRDRGRRVSGASGRGSRVQTPSEERALGCRKAGDTMLNLSSVTEALWEGG